MEGPCSARGTTAEEEARRLSTTRRSALLLPSSRLRSDQEDPGPDASSAPHGSARSRRSARGEQKEGKERSAGGESERHDGPVKRHVAPSRRSGRGEAKRRRGSFRRSTRREAEGRRTPSSSSSSPESGGCPSPPPPPPPPPAATPTWCWDCRVRPARLVHQPVPHLCLCIPCSAGGNRGCPACNTMVWVELLTKTMHDQDAEQQRNFLLEMLRGTSRWHVAYNPPAVPFDHLGADGSDARATPLILVKEYCLDCAQRPAVWVASCCGALLCPSCLESGLRRRHGRCRTPCVLGLVRRARATFEFGDDGAAFYLWREIRFALRERAGRDLLPGGRYVLRYFVSLADLHDRRRSRPARRRAVLYSHDIREEQHALIRLSF